MKLAIVSVDFEKDFLHLVLSDSLSFELVEYRLTIYACSKYSLYSIYIFLKHMAWKIHLNRRDQ